jgi:hypothetical protein
MLIIGGAHFERDYSDDPVRIEAFGVDWIVARKIEQYRNSGPLFASFSNCVERDVFVGGSQVWNVE